MMILKKFAIGAGLCAVAALSLGAADSHHPYEMVEEMQGYCQVFSGR